MEEPVAKLLVPLTVVAPTHIGALIDGVAELPCTVTADEVALKHLPLA